MTSSSIPYRASKLFTKIDFDGSGTISKDEIVQLMVRGGATSESTATLSADRLMAQASIKGKTLSEAQFLSIFQVPQRLAQ